MSLIVSLRSYSPEAAPKVDTTRLQVAPEIAGLILSKYPHVSGLEPHHLKALAEDLKERREVYADLTDGREQAVML